MEVNDIGWIDYRILELVYMRVEWIIQLYTCSMSGQFDVLCEGITFACGNLVGWFSRTHLSSVGAV